MGVLGRIRSAARKRRLTLEEPRLARALAGQDCALAKDIEARRAAMLNDTRPLADGSHGPAGSHDHRTVASACGASKPASAARVLHALVKEFQPQTVLELGTNVGISSSYLAAAGGKVTTLEASKYRLDHARKLHSDLGLKNVEYVQGEFADTLADAVRRLAPVDLAFIDGHHKYEPTIRYFEAIREGASPDCVFVFDDIRHSPEMERAWAELKPLFRVTAECKGMGIGMRAR